MHTTPPPLQFWGSQAEIRHNLLGASLAPCWIQVSFHRAQSYQAINSFLNLICTLTHVGHQTVSTGSAQCLGTGQPLAPCWLY